MPQSDLREDCRTLTKYLSGILDVRLSEALVFFASCVRVVGLECHQGKFDPLEPFPLRIIGRVGLSREASWREHVLKVNGCLHGTSFTDPRQRLLRLRSMR